MVPFAAGVSPSDDRGWVAMAKANDRRSVLSSARRLECAAARQLAKLGWYVVKELKRCRQSFFAETLRKLQRAHYNGDTEVSYRILRQLGKRTPRQVKSLRNKDGAATKDEDEIGKVWTQHLVDVLGGRKAANATECRAKPRSTVDVYTFWPSLLEIREALGKVNAKKALGPDGVGSDVWRAGGETLAVHILHLVRGIIVTEEVPTGMKGSRAVDLYKGKGPVDGVDSYRVLSIQDHLSKMFIGMLKVQVLDCFERDNPGDQYGGVEGGSTDVPTHVLHAFAQRAAASGRSYSIIFLDLEKAFDMVPRKFFMGARVDEDEVTVAMLVAMGMPECVAEWTCEFIRERGSVLDQWGVDRKVAKLISAIHTHSWMKHECAKEVVVTTRGGRQGCKIGGVIFGAVYAQALKDVRCNLRSLGLMRNESTVLGQPFWRHVSVPEGVNGRRTDNVSSVDGAIEVETCDVTFVDDEALFLERKSPDRLVEDTGKVLAAVSSTFRRYGLKLNWRPGKSEVLVSLRGTGATKVREDKLRQADGSLAMWAPPSDPAEDPNGPMERVCVVHKYKHLGTWLTSDGSLTIEKKHRAASACGALVALERTILGKKGCSWEMQCQFVQTLVMSRLLFKAHVWTLRNKHMVLLHRPYVRALRRIAGAGWRSNEAAPPITDSEVRETLVRTVHRVLADQGKTTTPEQSVQREAPFPNAVDDPGQGVWMCEGRYGGGRARPPLGPADPR